MAIERWQAPLAYFALAAAVFLAYAHTLGDPLIRDDYWLLGQVKDLDLAHLWGVFYAQPVYLRPLGMLMWWVQFHVFGTAGLPSDIVNVGMQAADACIVFWFISLLGLRRLTAFFAALLFAISPLGSETVDWSAARFDMIVLLLMILSLGLYYRYLRVGGRARYIWSLVATGTALMVKEPALMMVALVPLLELVYAPGFAAGGWRRLDAWKDSARRWAPFAGITLVYLVTRVLVLHGFGGSERMIGRPSLHASFYSIVAFLFPFSWLNVGSELVVWGTAVVLVLVAVAAGMAVLLCRACSPESRRAMIFFAGLYALALVPVYRFIFIDGIAQDLANSRYLYIPSLGFVAMVVIIVYEFGWRQRVLRYLTLAALMGLSLVNFWALQKDNQPWEAADAESATILAETQSLIPDPPPGAVFYYEQMPVETGYRLFEHLTLQPAIDMEYHRNDIQVYVAGDNVDPGLMAHAYMLHYDHSREQLRIDRRPTAS